MGGLALLLISWVENEMLNDVLHSEFVSYSYLLGAQANIETQKVN